MNVVIKMEAVLIPVQIQLVATIVNVNLDIHWQKINMAVKVKFNI